MRLLPYSGIINLLSVSHVTSIFWLFQVTTDRSLAKQILFFTTTFLPFAALTVPVLSVGAHPMQTDHVGESHH